MAEIRIRQGNQKISCPDGSNLLDALLEGGAFVDNPCSGKGICGKCKVKLLSGKVSAMTETEAGLLKEEEIKAGIRLSCLTEIYGEAEIELLKKEGRHKVLTRGYMPEFQMDSYESGYGIVIDIGTTTVVTALVELATGKELANASMINAQKHYGLDVLTRITYEYEHPDRGVRELQDAIVHSINGMIGEVCEEADVPRGEIRKIHVAANCTMTHMLLGVDARSIGRSPYRPEFIKAQTCMAREIGIEVRPVEKVLKDTRKNPEMLHKLLDLTVECSLKWFEAFHREFGPVATNFSDPVTCMDVISKSQFDEYSLPYIKKLIDGTEKIMGSRPGAHICGKTSPIWADLADAGLFSFSIDNCEDLAVAKAAVGDRMRIAGNVPPVDVMREGTIDEVIASCKECLEKCADSPAGFILNTGCQLPIGTPKANVEAFIYAARKYGRGARLGQMPRGITEE